MEPLGGRNPYEDKAVLVSVIKLHAKIKMPITSQAAQMMAGRIADVL